MARVPFLYCANIQHERLILTFLLSFLDSNMLILNGYG